MKKQVFASIVFLMFVSLAASAEKLDLSAHNSIIQKLESVADVSGDDSMVQKIEISHRLADLYAERARLLSMEDEGKGAMTNAKAINADREKAIATLNKILPYISRAEKGEVLMQVAHLHELLSKNNEALKIYKSIERTPEQYDSKTKSLSEIKLGDFSFADGDLTGAQKHFEKSLTFKENPRKAYAQYRLAWVNYNQGQTIIGEKKLVTLLKTPSLYTNAQGEVDNSFVEELTHDLATFMARNDLAQTDAVTYSKLNPDTLRKKNLMYLAQELDRTAKKTSALKVWAMIGKQELTFEDQLERQIQITKIAYDMANYKSLLEEMDHTIVILKSSKCKDNANCTLAQQSLRKIVADWARSEERKTSPELIVAFNKYTESFEDYEMNFWAATLAQKLKQNKDAFRFYLRAATLLRDISPKNAQQQKLFEQALVGGIDMAEFAKDPNEKLQAYRRYLEFNPNGAQKNEVRYQIAQWFYSQNQMTQARDEFKTLSLDKTMPMALREKSADLCMDANVVLKDDSRIEGDSYELAGQLKSKRGELLAIYRKSILNQSAAVLNSAGNDDKWKTQQNKLNSIDATSFAGEEKQQLLKNKLEIAYRLKDLDTLAKLSNELLAQKGLKQADQQRAYHYLAWTSEVRMNFKESLRYMKMIQPSVKEVSGYYMKMAMLKEFTSQNPTKEYEMFMSSSRDSGKIAFAAHQIVLHSAKPAKAFAKYESVLKRKSDLYASAALYVYEQTNDQKFAKQILSQSAFKKSSEASLIRHQDEFKEFRNLATPLARLKLRAGSDATIRKSLMQRQASLKQLEKLTNRSIAKKDTIEQLVFLPVLAFENQRLANEILALPLPKKLSKVEKAQYEAQLKQMVAPYENQSSAISAKVKEIWKQAPTQDLLADLGTWSSQVNRPGHVMALQELSLLKSSVQNLGLNSDAFEKLSEKRQKVYTEASDLQMKIYKSPFDFSYLEKMKTLQISLGSGTMVAYLDSRIDELNSRGR